MRRFRWLLALVVVGGVLAALLRPLASGEKVWSTQGELLVAKGWRLLPRWKWSEVSPGPVVADFPLSTREGARVVAEVRVAFPPGHYRLAPGPSASLGLEQRLRGRLPAPELACLANDACAQELRRDWQRVVSQELGLLPQLVELRLEADPQALLATKLAGLRARIAPPPLRVLLVGWDGADWQLLEPFAQQGVMPVLRKLMHQGTWGELTAFTPLLSPLLWTTIATGEPPERHGVLDFLEADTETGAKTPVTSRKRAVPALWNIASAMGFTVAVSGWWASWPAEAVNGVLVSDRLFYLLSDSVGDVPPATAVFPPEREAFFRELARRAREETDANTLLALFPVSPQRMAQALAEAKGMADPVDGFRRVLVGTRVYLGAALELLQAKPDLAMVYAIGTDEVGHVLAPYLPPTLTNADPEVTAAALEAVRRYFAVMDRWLGRLLDQCPLSECVVLLVSDHGFKWGSDRPRELSGVAAATAALWHRPNGVFLLAGQGVKRLGKVSAPASVYDVAPTVAALLGLPPGRSWRGRPLPGVEVGPGEAVDWVELLPPESFRPKLSGAPPSPEVVAQLKALGYLEGGEGQATGRGPTEGELNNLGLLHLQAKRYDEAERAFKQAAAINPTYASPYYNLRRLYFETARYDEADEALVEAVRRGLRDGVGAVARAVADYQQLGLWERALALVAKARDLFPQQPRFAAQQLALLVQGQKCQQALALAEALVHQFAQDPSVLAFAGLAAACAGENEKATRWLTRSLELDPNQGDVREVLHRLMTR